MGFTIFETSGTFTPSDYGLKVGDCIHIVCVGGGGGGVNTYNTAGGTGGTAGGSSSFGSILTSLGGSLGVCSTSPPANGIHSYPGQKAILPYINGTSTSTVEVYLRGSGADGWLPGENILPADPLGVFFNRFGGYPSASTSTSVIYNKHCYNIYYNSASSGGYNYFTGTVERDPRTDKRGGRGAIYSYVRGLGIVSGGRGYGAGGGSADYYSNTGYYSGGNAGEIKHLDYKLTSTDSIAVTVGNGGTGGYYYSAADSGGGGARGCVAIYW